MKIIITEKQHNHIITAIQKIGNERNEVQPVEVDERARSFANTRKKRLFPKSAMMANPNRFKEYDLKRMGLNETDENREPLNFFDLVSKRIIFITEPFKNGVRETPNWEHDTNIFTLWNLRHPEPGQEWIRQAIHFTKNSSVKWWNDIGQFSHLSDEKYNQILRSVELYKKENEKDKDAKFITCRNCRSKFTQTKYKNKKSLPICPKCGTHNNEHK